MYAPWLEVCGKECEATSPDEEEGKETFSAEVGGTEVVTGRESKEREESVEACPPSVQALSASKRLKEANKMPPISRMIWFTPLTVLLIAGTA